MLALSCDLEEVRGLFCIKRQHTSASHVGRGSRPLRVLYRASRLCGPRGRFTLNFCGELVIVLILKFLLHFIVLLCVHCNFCSLRMD